MGVDSLEYWPSSSSPIRTVFRDSVWSSSIGGTLWHQAPVLASLYAPHEFCTDCDDFFDYSTSNYTATLNSGTVALSTAAPGGVAVITSAAAATETTIQKIFVWNLHATKVLYHETMLSLDQATAGDMAVGLAIADTSPIAGAPSSAIYFLKATAAATIDAVTTSTTATTTAAVATLSDATDVKLGFVATSTGVTFYVNGSAVAHHATTIPETSIDLRWFCSVKGTATPLALAGSVNYHKTMQAR